MNESYVVALRFSGVKFFGKVEENNKLFQTFRFLIDTSWHMHSLSWHCHLYSVKYSTDEQSGYWEQFLS